MTDLNPTTDEHRIDERYRRILDGTSRRPGAMGKALVKRKSQPAAASMTNLLAVPVIDSDPQGTPSVLLFG
ncbi:hypothetical protein [Salinispora arenicola]|uniref:hypothetical protein n=1 Tax=Salinispora arenicola TaxID=168697 RepID=UPI00036F5446|nr:hypothetical protein [Salinispora arenicola]